ncbi:MAG: hypothetical protein COA66_10425 [Arcobacter sp.]|nr:MAG: hypothetical protein COA66_10425 [Arcobacter sp.]
MLEYSNVVRIIEFKNEENKSSKEREKIFILTQALLNKKEMTRISKAIHWYIGTKPIKEKLITKIKPYITAYERDKSSISLEVYIKTIIDEVMEDKCTTDIKKINEYIELIIDINKKGTKSGGKKSSEAVRTSGMIISASKKGILYAAFNDITQLKLQHKEFLESVRQESKSVMVPESDYNEYLKFTKTNKKTVTKVKSISP